MTYRQLTREQRYQIYALKKAAHSRTEIATIIGVHKSRLTRTCAQLRAARLSPQAGARTGDGAPTGCLPPAH